MFFQKEPKQMKSFWANLINATISVKTPEATFGATLGKNDKLFITSSGHTEFGYIIIKHLRL